MTNCDSICHPSAKSKGCLELEFSNQIIVRLPLTLWNNHLQRVYTSRMYIIHTVLPGTWCFQLVAAMAVSGRNDLESSPLDNFGFQSLISAWPCTPPLSIKLIIWLVVFLQIFIFDFNFFLMKLSSYKLYQLINIFSINFI